MDSRTRVHRPLRVRCPFTPRKGPTSGLRANRSASAGRNGTQAGQRVGAYAPKVVRSAALSRRRWGPFRPAGESPPGRGPADTPLRFRWGCKLASIQLGVEALLRKQAFVSALLHDAALIHHQYQFRIAYGAQAVGDDETGALSH